MATSSTQAVRSVRRQGLLDRLRVSLVAALVLATALVAVDVTPAQAASTVAVEATQVHQGAEITDDFRHWLNTAFDVQVANGPITRIKVQVEAYRSTDNPAVDAPYFSWVEGPVTSYNYITNVDVPAPPNAFQSGLSFQWRARWWRDGDGGNPSEWSSFETFSVRAATGRPGAPYPLSPSGPVAPDNNVLRIEQSRPEQTALTDPITEYMVEIKLSGSTEVYWETIVPAPASPTAMVEFNVPNLPDDTKFKWRAYARTASATDRDSQGSSSASRWRYFQTTGPQFQATFDYIPHRAGSYLAGDTGDEISGAVASRQYPGIYWMIRDNGPGDRARLYAVKIDPATGQLDNLDGYSTKEFEVQGATNLDWEAISIDSSGRLYVFDSGSYWDGDIQPRSEGLIYRIGEPNPYTATSASVQKIYPYTFPNGENFRNVEAVFNVGDVFFLIAKEDPHRVYSLPRWLSENGNSLWALGELSDQIGNISGAEFSTDLSRFGITTTPDKAYFWDLSGENFTPPSNSGTQSRAIVQTIIDNPPTSHYYYRQTDTWAADGIYASQTAGETDPLRLQRGMQTEGLAFAVNGNQEAMMVSEYGRHTMFVPATGTYNYYERPGINSNNAGAGGGDLPGTGEQLIPPGSWWYYDDDGTPSTDWNQPGASRASMQTGTALFGYPAQLGSEVETALAAPAPGHVTDYFVQDFELTDADDVFGLEFTMTYDDAAIMYLNGVEVWRDNMPSGVITPQTLALQWRNDNLVFQTNFVQLDDALTRSLLVDGTNTIAVELHQNRVDSSDSFFDLQLSTALPFQPEGLTGRAVFDGTDREVELTWQRSRSADAGVQEIWHRNLTGGDLTMQFIKALPSNATSDTVDVADDEIWNGDFVVLATSAPTMATWCGPNSPGCTRTKVSRVNQATLVTSAPASVLPFFDATTPALNFSDTITVPPDAPQFPPPGATSPGGQSSRVGRAIGGLARFVLKAGAVVSPYGAARYIFFGSSFSPFAATPLGGGELLLEAGVSTSTDWNDLETWAELNPDVLHRTVMYAQIINVAEPADGTEDFDLKRQIDDACSRVPQGNGAGCGDEVTIYLPGGENYLGADMVQTGIHIHDALDSVDAALGNWWNLERGEVPAPPRGATPWYDSGPWQPNACENRGSAACDEFPFWSTTQRIDGSGMIASLRPVPGTESLPQATDINGFYTSCSVGAFQDFMVISPPRSYIGNPGPTIKGNSFGLIIDFNGAETETTRCL